MGAGIAPSPWREVWESAPPAERVPLAPGVSGVGNGNPAGGSPGVGVSFLGLVLG